MDSMGIGERDSIEQYVEQYYGLIVHEARRANQMFNGFRGSLYNVDDLIQEGMLKLYYVKDKWDEKRGKFSTILTLVLRNHYSNLYQSEKRRNMAELEDDVVGCDMNYEEKIWVNEVLEQLSEPARLVCIAALELDKGFIQWLGRRDWARKNLKVRYKNVSVKKLLEEYFGRSLEKEFAEIAEVMGSK